MSEDQSQSFKVLPPNKPVRTGRRSMGFVFLGLCLVGGLLGPSQPALSTSIMPRRCLSLRA